MGSFNETCALTNLNIPDGTPVRVLFLAANSYARGGQHEAERGCNHYDNWFCRTPPLRGKYDDYGRAKLSRSPLSKLVADVFSSDVVERPYGFNQYHSPPVQRGKNIDHYLAAAWEGRLLVQDDYSKPPTAPEAWPTWERVFELLKKAKLPIRKKEAAAGYNAQPVMPGIVCVDFKSYDDITSRLAKAQTVLSAHYDCKVVKKFQNEGNRERCLIVTARGAFDDPSLIAETSKIRSALDTHPEIASIGRHQQVPVPVLAVMVREDAWQAFCDVPLPYSGRGDTTDKLDVASLRDRLSQAYDRTADNKKSRDDRKSGIIDADAANSALAALDHLAFRDILTSIPCQIMPSSHLRHAVEHEFGAKDELLQAVAELARVEIVMSRLHRPWYIPPLGGQDGEWELHTQLLADIHAISKKALGQEKSESDDD